MLMNDDDGGASFNTTASRGNPAGSRGCIRHWDHLGILTTAIAQSPRVKRLSMKILHKL
jgi:hypothetical protein